jgi:hypothetical protein
MPSKTALLTIAVILVPNADHGLPSPAPITRRPRRPLQAADLYGAGSVEYQTVAHVWSAVKAN